jgi:hypothetical protein
VQLKWLLTVGVLLVASCSRTPTVAETGCDPNGRCHLVGRLNVSEGGYGAGSISTERECYDLALPGRIFREWEKWDGKTVSLRGKAHARPGTANLLWYEIEDRRVEAGGCSARVIYVEEIEKR